MNQVCFTGRLVNDPEIRYTQNQNPVASFSLAVERDYKDANGERPVDFISCVAWNSSATFLERYAQKGAKLGVTGSLRSRKWQGKDGTPRYSTEVNCDKVELLEFAKRGDRADGEERPKRETKSQKNDEAPDSGYKVFTPPGMEDLSDSGELPF